MLKRAEPRRIWVSLTLLAFALVVLALTTLKSFFSIGLLWKPENQKVRSLELIPLEDIFAATSWFAPLFDYLGNFAFFVPLGALAAILLGPGKLWRVAGMAALFSLAIELTQFSFALGRTDIDDLVCNTLGGLFGAWLAGRGGKRWHTLITLLSGLAVLVFLVLVILGPTLGDPTKVVPVN